MNIQIIALLFLMRGTTGGNITFKEQCLKWHNYFRSKHQAPSVKWNDELELEAQTWASYLVANNKFEHSENFGENLFMYKGKSINEPCTRATKSFYDEIKFYNFNKPGFSQITGHFTQVVWKATSEIGAALASGEDRQIIVVVRYNPIGNVNGADTFKRNVLQPKLRNNGDAAPKSWPAVVLVMPFVAAFSVCY